MDLRKTTMNLYRFHERLDNGLVICRFQDATVEEHEMLIISGVDINRGRVYTPLEYAIRQACHNSSSDNLKKVGVFLRYGASLKSRPRHSAAKDLIEFAKLNGNQIPYNFIQKVLVLKTLVMIGDKLRIPKDLIRVLSKFLF